MRKRLALLLAGALVVGALGAPAAQAKKKKPKPKPPQKVEREVKGAYDAPALVVVGSCAATGAIGCVALATGAEERYVTAASVTDAHGQPVYVVVSADLNGDAQDDATYGSFCGTLAEPLTIDPGVAIHFWVGATPDPGIAGCAPAAATTGSVDVTFANML